MLVRTSSMFSLCRLQGSTKVNLPNARTQRPNHSEPWIIRIYIHMLSTLIEIAKSVLRGVPGAFCVSLYEHPFLSQPARADHSMLNFSVISPSPSHHISDIMHVITLQQLRPGLFRLLGYCFHIALLYCFPLPHIHLHDCKPFWSPL